METGNHTGWRYYADNDIGDYEYGHSTLDAEDNIMRRVLSILDKYIFPCLLIVSILGNSSCVLTVLATTVRTQSRGVYVTALAVCNITWCLWLVTHYVGLHVKFVSSRVACKTVRFVLALTTLNKLYAVLVVGDGYVALAYPRLAKTWRGRRAAVVTVTVLIMLHALYCVHVLVLADVKPPLHCAVYVDFAIESSVGLANYVLHDVVPFVLMLCLGLAAPLRFWSIRRRHSDTLRRRPGYERMAEAREADHATSPATSSDVHGLDSHPSSGTVEATSHQNVDGITATEAMQDSDGARVSPKIPLLETVMAWMYLLMVGPFTLGSGLVEFVGMLASPSNSQVVMLLHYLDFLFHATLFFLYVAFWEGFRQACVAQTVCLTRRCRCRRGSGAGTSPSSLAQDPLQEVDVESVQMAAVCEDGQVEHSANTSGIPSNRW